MKTTLPLMAIFIYLAFGSFFAEHARAEGGARDEFMKVTDGIFSFAVPITWRKMEYRELNIFKQQYEQQSSELFKQYYGRSEGYDSGVSFIIGFFAPKKEVAFVLLIMKIPVQAKDYLQQMYTQSINVIEWGKRQGKVKEVFQNRLTKINDIPALETDLEMGDRSRMANYSIYAGDHPDQAIQVTLLFNPGTYPKHRIARNRILSSLQINFKK